jgi:hypothetical protein
MIGCGVDRWKQQQTENLISESDVQGKASVLSC